MIPQELLPLAEAVNKMRDMFNLGLRRGLFSSIEENQDFLNGYLMLELEVRKLIEKTQPEELELPNEQPDRSS